MGQAVKLSDELVDEARAVVPFSQRSIAGQIELRELADIETGAGPNAVNRDNARRRMVIRCNTQGRDLASAVTEIQQKIQKQLNLPAGYFIEYSGQFESQQKATTPIAILAAVSVVGMFVVLMVLFPSVRIVLQILNALPTAFKGVHPMSKRPKEIDFDDRSVERLTSIQLPSSMTLRPASLAALLPLESSALGCIQIFLTPAAIACWMTSRVT